MSKKDDTRILLAASSPGPLLPFTIWERAVQHAFRRRQHWIDDIAENRRSAETLMKDLARHTSAVRDSESKFKREVEAAAASVARQTTAAVASTWRGIARLNKSLLRVEFEAERREQVEERQERMLEESERLTQQLVAGLIESNKSETAKARGGKRQRRDLASLDNLQLLNTNQGARPLRPYQRDGVNWLINLREHKLNGILADEMGLGKTIQAIALLCHLAENERDWGPHLIVVPTTVVLNWESEFRRWAPGMKVVTYIGSQAERQQVRKGWTKEDAFVVTITSYTLIQRDYKLFQRRRWGYLILDEAHQIKNWTSQSWSSLFELRAEHRLLLTGTPLQTSVMELWSLFHFIMPATSFQSDQEFREWFSSPLHEMVATRSALNERLVARLHSMLRPFFLRRLKSEVEKDLPSKREVDVFCHLSKRQRGLYEAYIHLTETRSKLTAGDFGGACNVLLQLRRVCNHPELFAETPIRSPLVLSMDDQITFHVPSSVLMCEPEPCIRLGSLLSLTQVDCGRLAPCGVPAVFPSFLRATGKKLFKTLYPEAKAIKKVLNASSKPSTQEAEDFVSRFPMFEQIARTRMKRSQSYCDHRVDAQLELLKTRQWIHQQLCDSSESSARGEASSLMSFLIALAFLDRLRLDPRRRLAKKWNRKNGEADSVRTVGNDDETEVATDLFLDLKVRTQFEDLDSRMEALNPIIQQFLVVVPAAVAKTPLLWCRSKTIRRRHTGDGIEAAVCQHFQKVNPRAFDAAWTFLKAFHFPEPRRILHDSGKLQVLKDLLKRLKAEKHRCLIFTQMTAMLTILERFLAMLGLTCLRLDGSTRPVERQRNVERFNSDERVFCMILSTRAGGIGLNLIGADTVIFYDSDWNPAMDLQAQDRCHRIGQTRPVTIYRLITENTVEHGIIAKARERKMLNNVVIRGGNFNALRTQSSIEEQTLSLFYHDLDEDANVRSRNAALGAVEDDEDQEAQRALESEMQLENATIDETVPSNRFLDADPARLWPPRHQSAVIVAAQDTLLVRSSLSAIERDTALSLEVFQPKAVAQNGDALAAEFSHSMVVGKKKSNLL